MSSSPSWVKLPLKPLRMTCWRNWQLRVAPDKPDAAVTPRASGHWIDDYDDKKPIHQFTMPQYYNVQTMDTTSFSKCNAPMPFLIFAECLYDWYTSNGAEAHAPRGLKRHKQHTQLSNLCLSTLIVDLYARLFNQARVTFTHGSYNGGPFQFESVTVKVHAFDWKTDDDPLISADSKNLFTSVLTTHGFPATILLTVENISELQGLKGQPWQQHLTWKYRDTFRAISKTRCNGYVAFVWFTSTGHMITWRVFDPLSVGYVPSWTCFTTMDESTYQDMFPNHTPKDGDKFGQTIATVMFHAMFVSDKELKFHQTNDYSSTNVLDHVLWQLFIHQVPEVVYHADLLAGLLNHWRGPDLDTFWNYKVEKLPEYADLLLASDSLNEAWRDDLGYDLVRDYIKDFLLKRYPHYALYIQTNDGTKEILSGQPDNRNNSVRTKMLWLCYDRDTRMWCGVGGEREVNTYNDPNYPDMDGTFFNNRGFVGEWEWIPFEHVRLTEHRFVYGGDNYCTDARDSGVFLLLWMKRYFLNSTGRDDNPFIRFEASRFCLDKWRFYFQTQLDQAKKKADDDDDGSFDS